MKKSITKYVFLIIAVCMLCMLVACGGGNADTGSNASVDAQAVDTDSSEAQANTAEAEASASSSGAKVDNSGKAVASTSAPIKYKSANPYTLFDATEEVFPTLDYECPYEFSKCVSSINHSFGEYTTTWDVYIYISGDILGTWIVNEAGNEITFGNEMYFETFSYTNDITSQNRILLGCYLTDGKKLFSEPHMDVWPSGKDLNQFAVITISRFEPELSDYLS